MFYKIYHLLPPPLKNVPKQPLLIFHMWYKSTRMRSWNIIRGNTDGNSEIKPEPTTPKNFYHPNQLSIRYVISSFNSRSTVPLGVVVQRSHWLSLAIGTGHGLSRRDINSTHALKTICRSFNICFFTVQFKAFYTAKTRFFF